MLVREAVGRVLQDQRAERGLTLRQLAARSCCSLSYVSELERGRKEASSEVVAAVCAALGVTVADLLVKVAAVLVSAEPEVAA